ncbi:MAG TPA: hypothetical protein ENK63_03540 [Rhodobacterales bacterium]|nr:hypothetical protein [Rhodobacterales bacterium]
MNQKSELLETLTRTAYWFGEVGAAMGGPVSFTASGLMLGASGHSAQRFRLDGDDILVLMTTLGDVVSELKYNRTTGGFDPMKGAPHYLQPALALDPARKTRHKARVFVNTVPKAGTYLLAKALELQGFHSVGLHVMDDFVHDNRGIEESEIHWNPWSREVPVPARTIAAMLRPGEFAVGHVFTVEAMRAIRNEGVTLINVIREPRGLLASMYTFKRTKVRPNRRDRLWQSMSGEEALKAYLISQPVESWIEQIRAMAIVGQPLRFEEISQGQVDSRAVGGRWLARQISDGLAKAKGQETATYSGRSRARDHALFEDVDVRRFLDDVGATDVSQRFWSDLNPSGQGET